MLICRNAEGVHGKRKLRNPCFNPKDEATKSTTIRWVY